uniref:hypothetical protein n=1 Tax=Embleya scabrispora TaxID=159449 RepID=UPI000374537B
MGNRPTDWNAIGLSTDPTPGDPVRLRTLITSMDSLGRVAREIDDALDAVLDKTGDGAFVGQTADALREKISGPLREFVQSIADAFENSAKSMRAYLGVMEAQQQVADTALSHGRDLPLEDPRRATYGTTARTAGTTQRTQAEATAKVVNSAAAGIKQPVSNCDLFWEAFNWLAIILILPALLLGGPLALLAIGVNLALFVKTAVDVAQGKAGLLDLFLAGLGIIAPTTKGLNLLKLFKDGAKFLWNGLKTFGKGAWGALKGAFGAGAFRSFAFIPGLKDFARLAGGWVKTGALWVGAAALKLPSWVGSTLGKGGLAVINGFKAIPALFRGLPGLIKGAAGSTWKFLKSELGGGKWLRLILPVDAAEISRFGLKRALQIGFYERGVLGRFRYGGPLLAAGGRGLSQIPTPPPLHGAGALPAMPVDDLARIRAGDWSGFGADELRMHALDLPTTNLTVTSPAGLHIPTSFGEVMQFAPDAVRRMDALVDIGMRDMKLTQIGDWAKLPTPAMAGKVDHLPGVDSIGRFTPNNAPATTLHALPANGALPSVAHTPSLTSLSALDLVQTGAGHRPNTPSLLTGGGPGGGSGIGHLANPSLTNHGLTAPGLPGSGLTNHGLTAPGLPGHGTPGPHVELKPTEFGTSTGQSAPSPTALAGGPPPAALVPDHAGNALNLLDHGPKTPLRLDSPANAGALPPAPPPHGPGGGDLRPGTPTANQVAVAPSPPTHGGGLTGPANRLSPTQLEQLWQRDADRIGALFGKADDPLRTGRVEAWRDLASARTELGRAQQVLHDLEVRPGGSSKPSPFERDARLAVDHASTKVETALTRLDRLGVDPARIDRGLAQAQAESLLERPRLVGGSGHEVGGGAQSLPTTSVAGSIPPPTAVTVMHVGLDSTGLDGAAIRTTVNDGHRVTDPATGRSIRYDHNGSIADEGLALRSPGEPRFVVDNGTGPTLTDVHGNPVAGMDVTVVRGGYRVTDTAGGHTIRYRANGAIAEQGIALGGTGAPHFVVAHGDLRPPVLTNAHGKPITDRTLVTIENGYRVTDPATGRSIRYGADGGVAEHGLALQGAGEAHFVVPGEHGPLLTDLHGNPVAGVDVTAI